MFVAEDPDLLNYQIDPPAYDVAPTPFAEVDVLLTQGMRDTLFNFNEAWRNFECLKASGGDVRLLTHQTGHILPAEAPMKPSPPNTLTQLRTCWNCLASRRQVDSFPVAIFQFLTPH